MPAATTSVSGYLTSTDWNTFNGKYSIGGALGTPSSGIVTNLTGTASININGTVGATTASTGAFTTLSATGVSSFAAGTALLPAITRTGDTNTGIWFPAADTIAFTEGGAECARFDSNGNFGIGTPSPTSGYRLDVSGNFKVSGSIDENVYAVVDAAGVAISPQNGTIQTWTLGASRTPTAGTWIAGESITLMINDGTAYTVTWTTLAITWVGGTAPTLATTGFTVIELWKVGTTIYGALVGSVA
jgi:hypothetical protein